MSAPIRNVTKCVEKSPCQCTQKQTNEARNEASVIAITASGNHKNPENHVEEIAMKNPPTENVVGQKAPNM
jgi:hypothetical protein